MKKSERNMLGAIVLLGVMFVGLTQMGYLKNYGINPFLSQTGTGGNGNGNGNNSTGTGYSDGIGKYQLGFYAADSADSSPLTIGTTGVDIWVLHYVNGQYSPEGGAYDPTKTLYFTATSADNGNMWIEVKPHSTDYYVDYQTILQKEGFPGYVSGVQYVTDPLSDGHKDFLFQFDLKNQAIPNSGYPVLTFTAWAIKYDGSFGGITAGQLGTNASSIGAVSVPKYYEQDMTFSASKLGVAFYKVQVIFGNATKTVTDQNKAVIKSVSFPGMGTIDGTQFDQQFTTQDIRYTYNFATSLYGADYQSLAPNGNNKFPINIQIQFTLTSGDEIPVYVIGYYFDNSGAGHSFSATFYANE